jgi:tetraacyldisaccharide 4'-kinase
MLKLKEWYLGLLEKEQLSFFEKFFYILLYFLSFIYKFFVYLRNLLYDKKILSSYSSSNKVISVGGLSWAGSGKTTLSILLYKKLSSQFKVAILRRGYGEDENNLLKEKKIEIFFSPNRVNLAKNLTQRFDIFILDDGFQYRKLEKDCDIVIMGPNDFKKINTLIPASCLREPLNSLNRADILVLNYRHKIENIHKAEELIKRRNPHLKVYFSRYKFIRFISLRDGKSIELDYLKKKKVAALTAIGYPDGFFDLLRELDLTLTYIKKYPDHYILSEEDFNYLKLELFERGIKHLLITYKDKYHFPEIVKSSDLEIFITEIDMEIEDEDDFLKSIKGKLNV